VDSPTLQVAVSAVEAFRTPRAVDLVEAVEVADIPAVAEVSPAAAGIAKW